MDLQSLIGIPTDAVANEQRLRRGDRVSYPAFQSVIGAFFGMAILAFTARMAHRLKTRCRLSLEDYVLIVGVACLSAVTGILYRFTRIVYLFEAAAGARPIDYIFTIQDIILLEEESSVVLISNAGMCLAWTVIYSVKFYFLALFRLLINRVSRRISIYFWVVVAVTTLFWLIQMGFSVIPCHHLDLPHQYKCLARMTMVQPLANVCDIATDIMIVTIPFLVLRKSQIKSYKRLGLYVFLCLSTVMIIIAITRSLGYLPQGATTKATWQYLWLYIEASIAIIMASITAFSAFVLTKDYKAPNQKKKNQRPPYPFSEGLLQKKAWRNRLEWEERDGEHLPHVPSATLTGIRTFIHRQGRSTEVTEASETMQSTPQYFFGRKESTASTAVSSV